MNSFDELIVILASVIRLAVPLILGCLAGLWSERSGIIDVGLEGKMLTGAFAAAAGAALTGSAWIGLFTGVSASVLVSLVHGYASIEQRANQIVSGVAINMIADGLTALLGNAQWEQGGRTPSLPSAALFNSIELPFTSQVGMVPVIGPVYEHLISGNNLITYAAFLMAPVTYWVLYNTRFGLRLRAVGENPAAVDTAGISVHALRYAGVLICGVLVGAAGAYLSIAQAAYFQPHMTAGQGYIALAALVFAKWKPMQSLATCLLFGLLDVLSIRMQGTVLPVIGPVPVQAIQALPYVLTVVLLAGFIGKAIPPRASGIPYVKER